MGSGQSRGEGAVSCCVETLQEPCLGDLRSSRSATHFEVLLCLPRSGFDVTRGRPRPSWEERLVGSVCIIFFPHPCPVSPRSPDCEAGPGPWPAGLSGEALCSGAKRTLLQPGSVCDH